MLRKYTTQFEKEASNPHKLLILSIGSGKITADQLWYCIVHHTPAPSNAALYLIPLIQVSIELIYLVVLWGFSYLPRQQSRIKCTHNIALSVLHNSVFAPLENPTLLYLLGCLRQYLSLSFSLCDPAERNKVMSVLSGPLRPSGKRSKSLTE